MTLPTDYIFKVKNKVPLQQKIKASLVATIVLGAAFYPSLLLFNQGHTTVSFIILIVAIFVAVVLGLYLAMDWHPLDEKIRLGTDYLESELYGKVNFRDILLTKDQSLPGRTSIFVIRLNDGTTRIWSLFNTSAREANEKILKSFCRDFRAAFEIYRAKHPNAYPHHYSFRFIDTRGYLYALLCLVFIPFLFIPNDIDDFGLWVLPLIFIPFLGGIFLMIKKTIRKDEISLNKDFLDSKIYGKIDFTAIRKIISIDDPTQPALTLKLTNEKKALWKTDIFRRGGDTDRILAFRYAELWHFIQDFNSLVNTDSQHKTASQSESFSKPTKERIEHTPNFEPKEQRAERIYIGDVEKNSKQDRVLNSRGPKHKISHTRKRKARNITIYSGFLVIIILLGRHFTEQYRKTRNPLYRIEEKSEYARKRGLATFDDSKSKDNNLHE